MAFDPTTDSWAPGEPPVGNASVLAPDTDKPTGSAAPPAKSALAGGYPDTSGLFSDLKEAAQKKYGMDSYLYNTYSDQLDRDRGRMQQAFDKESAAADDLALTHPWNADQQRADRIRGPLEQFGSVGMVFALAASAFSKTPMVSALNAGAAAMSAMRQSDELGYKSAYEAWKANTDLAVKRFDIERAVYDDANKLATTDVAAWKTKMAAAAAQFDNQKILAMLDHGMDAEVFKAIEAQTQARDQVVKYQEDMQDLNLTANISKTNFAKWQEANPPPPGFEEWMNKQPLPPGSAPVQELAKYGLEMRGAENQAAVAAKKQVYDAKHTTYGAGGLTTSKDQATRIVERTQQLVANGEETDPVKAHARAAHEVQEADSKARAGGHSKIDASIVNSLDMYPGMTESDLKYISPTVQPKLTAALRDSPENLEAIAAYAKANPKALGLIADASKRINLDAYQGLFKSDPAAAKAKIDADRDAAIDQLAKEKKLDLTQAAQAKVLQKMLTTQAFTDAALAGSRGATIYLDKAFKEIYDPTSSPGAFFSILEKRYDEADRQAEKYHLGFDRRSPEALEKMPFWTGKAAGYAGKEVDKPPVAGAVKAADGWYVEATSTTPGARKAKDGKYYTKVQ